MKCDDNSYDGYMQNFLKKKLVNETILKIGLHLPYLES